MADLIDQFNQAINAPGSLEPWQIAAPGPSQEVDPNLITGNSSLDQYSYAGGGGYNAAAAQAAAAEAARQAQVRQQIQQAQQNVELGGRAAVGGLENTYSNNTRDFLRGLETGQSNLNTSRVNNALNLRRSMASIAQGVKQGIRSGGVKLGNMNASDSSAAEALQRAYARQGNQQTGQARNQFGLQNNTLMNDQSNLDKQRADQILALDQGRNLEVDKLVASLQQQLQTLDADAAAQGVTGVVDIGIKDRLIADAINRLHTIDAMRNERLAAIKQLTPQEIEAQAVLYDQQGMSTPAPFVVDRGSTMEASSPGLDAGGLPLFVRRRDEGAATA